MKHLIGEIRWQRQAQPVPLSPLPQQRFTADSGWLSHDGHCWLGSQTISSHCGRFTLVFTGEVVNHLQVRGGLRFQGWRSASDGETLVEGLAQRGLALVLELRGSFAFAAYDRQKQQLLLGRDRLGMKPLHLRWIEGGLRFASERRALGDHQGLSGQQISQALGFGRLHTPAGFCGPDGDGIHSLPAGLVVRINRERRHDPVRYWPPQPRPDWSPLPIRNGRWARQFLRQQLEEAVQLQLQGDRPLACCLSPGLGSGILTALACRLQPGRIASFTVSLAGTIPDDCALTRQLARHCGSDHHELQLDHEQALAWLQEGLQALETPSANGLNNYLISRAVVEQGIQVGLSGLGADALFGGSSSHRLVPRLLPLRRLPPALRYGLLALFNTSLASRLQDLPRWDRWHLALALRRCFGDSELAAAGADPLPWPDQPPQRITQGWGQISWAEMFGTTEPMLLRDSDALSQAAGLELRMPFLDHRIAEIALRMPQRYQRTGNGLLRAACLDLIPTGYPDRVQQGLSLPMRFWMLGPLSSMCRSRLEALQASGWLQPPWVNRQWQLFEAGQLHWTRTWCLVVLGEWAMRSQQQ
jgi:asparagine synthase (glutamine-hydrolysing)